MARPPPWTIRLAWHKGQARFLALLWLALPCPLAGGGPGAQVLWEENFNGGGKSAPATRLLQEKEIALAPGAGPDDSDAVRVAYVPSDRGSQRVTARFPLDQPMEEATLSFDVRFDRDFVWAKGGKLHGLGPLLPITGGADREPDGWSARVTFKQEGRCATYLYDQDKTKKYGIGDLSEAPVFQPGRWHHVVLQVRLNRPGLADGSARIFVDGREKVTTEGVECRDDGSPKTLIRTFLFSTFYGGSSGDWSPRNQRGEPVTVHAFFDNFRIWAGVSPADRAPLSR